MSNNKLSAKQNSLRAFRSRSVKPQASLGFALAYSQNSKLNELSIGMVSASVIAFQLALMQIFSITQWYHFANMVISVALLGFGASGTILSIFRDKILQHFSNLFPFLIFLSALTMATVTTLVHTDAIRFDTYLLFSDYSHWLRLAVTCLLLILPFLFAALAIGMSFAKYPNSTGKLYFVNMLGSGIGGAFALTLMWLARPSVLPAIIALLPLVAGLACMVRKRYVMAIALIACVTTVAMTIYSPELQSSQYKSINKTMLLPGAKVVFKKSSPYGAVEVVNSPSQRYAPGLSLNYTGNIPVRSMLFNNGNWAGAIIPRPAADSMTILSYTVTALPYYIGRPGTVLLPDVGSGENIALAQSYKAVKIDAIEPNRIITSLLKNELAAETDSMLYSQGTETYSIEPRTFLQTSGSSYDLIQLPAIGSFFGTSGIEAFHTRYDLTTEAFREMWQRLSPNGMISVSCWMDYPVRNAFKLLATIKEMLDNQGIKEPEKHIAAVRSWNALEFIVRHSEFTEQETAKIIDFCDSLSFDILLLPGKKDFDREVWNQLDDPLFFEAIEAIMSPGTTAFDKDYPFRVEPSTDNRPYFSQFIKIQSLPQLAGIFGNQSIPYIELGYVVVLLTFAVLLVASFILIIIPMAVSRYRSSYRFRTFIYFTCIGLGYMFLEIVFIQQFNLFLGHPLYSATGVISVLLIASGIGSYLSGSFKPTLKRLYITCISIAGVLLLYGFILSPALQHLMMFQLWQKLIIMIIIVGIPGIIMSMPFPLRLTRLGLRQPEEIPWAWAVNGCASVVGTTLGVIVSVEAGFNWVLFSAAAVYALAALSQKLAVSG